MRYTSDMALNNGINVRLDPAIRARLEVLAARFGVKSSLLIRQAIIEKLDEVENASTLTVGSIAKNMSGGSIGSINVATKTKRTKGK